MRGFKHSRGTYVARLEPEEKRVVAGVVADVGRLLGEDVTLAAAPADGLPRWSTEQVDEPVDPAVARLLPPARPEPDEVAQEFRRLTQADLRAAKVDRLRRVWAGLSLPGDRLSVPEDQAMDWAAALTDIRLVLAERLGIESDEDAEAAYELAVGDGAGQDELSLALASLYAVLTWLQESLMEAMLRRL